MNCWSVLLSILFLATGRLADGSLRSIREKVAKPKSPKPPKSPAAADPPSQPTSLGLPSPAPSTSSVPVLVMVDGELAVAPLNPKEAQRERSHEHEVTKGDRLKDRKVLQDQVFADVSKRLEGFQKLLTEYHRVGLDLMTNLASVLAMAYRGKEEGIEQVGVKLLIKEFVLQLDSVWQWMNKQNRLISGLVRIVDRELPLLSVGHVVLQYRPILLDNQLKIDTLKARIDGVKAQLTSSSEKDRATGGGSEQ